MQRKIFEELTPLTGRPTTVSVICRQKGKHSIHVCLLSFILPQFSVNHQTLWLCMYQWRNKCMHTQRFSLTLSLSLSLPPSLPLLPFFISPSPVSPYESTRSLTPARASARAKETDWNCSQPAPPWGTLRHWMEANVSADTVAVPSHWTE